MTLFLSYLITGLGFGFAYAIASMGLTLTFRTSGIFNFAQGAIAAAGAFFFYQLEVKWGMPYGLALPVAVLVTGVVLGLILEVLARVLSGLAVPAQVGAVIGILLILNGGIVAIYGNSPIPLDHYFPTDSFKVAGVHVTAEQVIEAVIAIALLVGVTLLLNHTRIGLSMNAVVRDSQLLDLTGMSPSRARRLAWIIGSCFGVLSGILLAPSIGLNLSNLFLLVITAFGGAAIGGFTSLPRTFAGAIGLGLAHSLTDGYLSKYQSLGGLSQAEPFIALFLVLAFATRKQLASMALGSSRNVSKEYTEVAFVRYFRGFRFAALAVLFLLAPAFAGTKLIIYQGGLVGVLLFLSLAVLIRLSGQVSFAVGAFAAVGGTTFGHLLNAGVPWLLALILAGLICAPIGALIAIPAIRLPGAFLAVASLGFAILLQYLFYPTALMFGEGGRLLTRRPSGLGSDTQYYYVLLAAVVIACVVIHFMQSSRLGRLLRGMAYSPTALSTAGLNVAVTRVLAFAISAIIAGIAGALSGPIIGGVSFSGTGNFAALNAVQILAILFVCGRNVIVAALTGGVLYVLPDYSQNSTLTDYYPIFFGVLVILFALVSDTGFVNFFKSIPAGARSGRGPATGRWVEAQEAYSEPSVTVAAARQRPPRDPRPPTRTSGTDGSEHVRRPQPSLSGEGAR